MWNALVTNNSNGEMPMPISRRRHERRTSDICMARLNGQAYPVIDWSYGGVKLDTDGRSFEVGHVYDISLSIKTHNRIWDINHSGTVVRKTGNDVGMQFDPLPGHVRTQMETVQRQVRLSRIND